MGGTVNLEKAVSLSHADPDTNRIGVNLKITTKTNFNRQVKYKFRQRLKLFLNAFKSVLICVHPRLKLILNAFNFRHLRLKQWF